MKMKLLVLLPLLLTACDPRGCLETKVVKEVGGCDRSGDCSVIYEDGSYERDIKQPAKGLRRCTKYGKLNEKK